jgi:hypothetical protein
VHTIPLKRPLDDTRLPHQLTPATTTPVSGPSGPAAGPGPVNTARYHHPHYLGTSPDGIYCFAPFTGHEPQPDLPRTAAADPALTPQAWCELHAHYTAARIAWSHARFRLRATPLLTEAAPLWEAWQTARDQLAGLYEEFRTLSDDRWAAQFLRLGDAEHTLREAATAFDDIAYRLADAAADQAAVAGWDHRLPLTAVASQIGLDTRRWPVYWIDDYTQPGLQTVVRDGTEQWIRATPLVGETEVLISEQRERLQEAAAFAQRLRPHR